MSAAQSVLGVSEAVAQVVEQAQKSVVRVQARHSHRGDTTGIVWSDGVVVTASHGIERDERIGVIDDAGKQVEATLAGRDDGTDLAVLRADTSGATPLVFAELEGVKVGHLVLALARPGRTVRATLGIVSVLGDGVRLGHGGKVDRFLQSDADTPRGFSGGPLVDLQGRALGVNTSGLLRGGALTVPTTTVRRVTEELLSHGRIRRGYLGVGVHPVRLPPGVEAQIGKRMGALIVAVENASPAERARLYMGDVLVSIDGHAVATPGDLAVLLEERIGVEVEATIVRAGKVEVVKVTTGQRA